MPIPAWSWFLPRPPSALPHPDRRSWRGCAITSERQARVSGLAGAARRAGRRCCRQIRAAQRGAVDADGDAVVLQAVEQRVDQRLVVEQPVPVGELEGGGDDGRDPGGALI